MKKFITFVVLICYSFGIQSNTIYKKLQPSQGSSKHAYINNLNPKQRKTLTSGVEYRKKKVINTKTGEIFESGVAAAKSINYSHGRLSKMLLGQRRNKTNFKYL